MSPKQNLKNYYTKKTAPWASVLGDAFVVMIPMAILAIQGAPNMSDHQKYWWMQGCSMVLAGLKFLLKAIKVKEEIIESHEESID